MIKKRIKVRYYGAKNVNKLVNKANVEDTQKAARSPYE